jgi:tRNA ligase
MVASVVRALEQGTKRRSGKGQREFVCKKTTFKSPGVDPVALDCWKFLDWDYKRDDLPTYARGLFTYKTKDGRHQISTRGYDKFFNIGEVNDTKWENIRAVTKGPYELSVKENGCIIFISGLEDEVLLVCSKHSTGERGDASASHAAVGDKWVDKHLATVGKTRKDLARELRKRNATAVAELCDDSFEEHVLAYGEDSAGLYLHGINLNVPEFATYPGDLVHEFADEWGFKRTEFLIRDDIDSTKALLESCAETGSWNGKDTEGFVIRCKKRDGEANGGYVDWFFKYKFEEPYLMYRQWREATKAVIAGRKPKFKKHQQITEDYLLYARRQLAKTPGLGKRYNANHGIIEMRDGFLKELGMKGSDIIRQEAANIEPADEIAHNVILVPVATIGCGKTTVAVALVKLFGWGHVQNDNITGQKHRPRQFVTQISNSLAEYPVVIADRNNHQRRERRQIIEDLSKVVPSARFVALHYVHEPKPQLLPGIRRVTQERVLERGDNHQTIQAGSKSTTEIVAIMEGFLHRFEAVDASVDPDNGFDEIIDLDVLGSSRQNLETVVNALHKAYPKLIPEVPSVTALDEAIAEAMEDYKPIVKHDLSFHSKAADKDRDQKNSKQGNKFLQPKPAKLEYFSIRLPTNEVLACLDTTFSDLDATTASFYRRLQQSGRVQPSFHVTLIHRASIASNAGLWDHLSELYLASQVEQQGTPDPLLGKCRVRFERIVWNDRVMCITTTLLDAEWETANTIAHITIGTAHPNIKPKESNDMLQNFGRGAGRYPDGISEVVLKDKDVLFGEVWAVLQRGR